MRRAPPGQPASICARPGEERSEAGKAVREPVVAVPVVGGGLAARWRWGVCGHPRGGGWRERLQLIDNVYQRVRNPRSDRYVSQHKRLIFSYIEISLIQENSQRLSLGIITENFLNDGNRGGPAGSAFSGLGRRCATRSARSSGMTTRPC